MPSSTEPFILIVDDSPTNLSILFQALKTAGYQVRTAKDGKEALAQVYRAYPELILLDIQMPHLDGFSTFRCLQANPATKGIPIIFTTSIADTETKVKGLSLGAVDYITKPFEKKEVLARVKTHWRLKQLTDSLEQQVIERTHELQQTQVKLVQQEKLSTLGQLVAGVAHEINNPVSFLKSNIKPAQDCVKDLLELIDLYQKKLPTSDQEITDKVEEIDLDFLRKDLPQLFNSMNIGVERIENISHSLCTFSRTDHKKKTIFNLHEGLDITLKILSHRLKANEHRPTIQVIKNYGQHSTIKCFAGPINQVFMNLVANAIDALDEVSEGQNFQKLEANPNCITITTTLVNPQQIQIQIADNGVGMTEEIQTRIFDNLFTTKAVGKGTGLGLAIVKQIIQEHGGSLNVKSQVGQGTEFCIQLPLQ